MRSQSRKQALTLIDLTQACSTTLFLLAPIAPLKAQIIPDHTLGSQNSIVTPNVNQRGIPGDRIDGGAIRGANLFHSFWEFNIGEGRSVYFTSPSGIENILSRVRGPDSSNILGTLGVLGNANLFLINPNGLVFGPQAKLDLRGSFVASTASAINFADGTNFSTSNPIDSPLLTISTPIGLQYRNNPGNLILQGVNLRVPIGKTLALVGGNLSLDGASLLAPGGRIELGGLAVAGTVGLNLKGDNLQLSFPDNVARADVSVDDQTNVDVSASRGGSIDINAQNLNISGQSKLQAGIKFGLGTTSSQSQAEDIDINATGEINLRDGSFINNLVGPKAVGTGGDINITTGSLFVTGGALLGASTFGIGNAGNVNIHAENIVSFEGVGSNTFSSGAYSRVESLAKGNGGDINITTESLSLANGARLGTSTLGQGDAGNVNIHAGSTVSFDGVGSNGYSSGAASTVARSAVGNGRSVNITARSLSLTNGAVMGASTSGKGNGGNVILDINTLELLNGGQVLTTSFSRYTAGNITIKATGRIDISGSDFTYRDRLDQFGGDIVLNVGSASGLFANTSEGNAGNLYVTAGSIRLDNQASISAETSSRRRDTNQANITLNAQDLVLRHGSQITTKALGSANGGNITIDTDVLVAIENSQINANSANSRGGNVNITAQGIFAPTSSITATGKESSLNGIVTINTSGADPSRGLVTLPSTVVEPAALIAQNPCQRGKSSSFVITGRGGLPPNPSEALTNDATQVGLVEPASSLGYSSSVTRKELPTHPTTNRIVPAVGWVFNNKGEVVLTADNPINMESQRPWVNPNDCFKGNGE